jgi:hypothetical protein
LLFGLFHQIENHLFERARRLRLTEIAVLMQAVFGLSTFVQLETQVDVRNHNGLVRRTPRAMTTRGQDFMEQTEGGVFLVNVLELNGTTKRQFGLVEERIGRSHGDSSSLVYLLLRDELLRDEENDGPANSYYGSSWSTSQVDRMSGFHEGLIAR